MAKNSSARKSKKSSKTTRSRGRAKLPKRKKKTKKRVAKKRKTAKTKPRTKAQTRKTTKKKSKKTKAKAKTRKTTSKKKTTRRKKAATKIAAKNTNIVSFSQPTPITTILNVGETAPNFTLYDQADRQVSLSDYSGRRVVLYFYPKDDTPGCTREACSFRDNLMQFRNLDAVILGVSFDDQQSHQKFIEKYGLNFSLLCDAEKEVANKYGVYVQKNMYGKTYWGIERSTFIVDPQGKIAAIFRNVKVEGHTEDVIQALSGLAA